MRRVLFGALPCLLLAQGPAGPQPSPPLTYEEVLHRARPGLDQLRLDAWRAERNRELVGSSGLLREGPTLGWVAGPRHSPALPGTTDQSADVDFPLFLSPGTRRNLVRALDQADPLLKLAARRETALRLRQAYLDVWLEQRVWRLRVQDLATVQAWLKAAQSRWEAGADPAFQVALVEGEILKAQMELADSRRRLTQAWASLRGLADLPAQSMPVADLGPAHVPPPPEGLARQFEASPMRKALQARLAVEVENLRHREALALSRWTLRGSYGKEGEDHIAKVGLSYRFGRPGETQAMRRETETGMAMLQRELQVALADLDGRFQAALERMEILTGISPTQDFQAAIQAVGLRLQAGKERPSDVLPIRRQLLEAEVADLRHQQAQHLLSAELKALTEDVTP